MSCEIMKGAPEVAKEFNLADKVVTRQGMVVERHEGKIRVRIDPNAPARIKPVEQGVPNW